MSFWNDIKNREAIEAKKKKQILSTREKKEKKKKKKWEENEKNISEFKKRSKKQKNEKMKNEKKMEEWKFQWKWWKITKTYKKMKTNEEISLHTQNPRRFLGFAVVVVTFFYEITDDFHDFSECVSFLKKINNQFWEVAVFFWGKVTIFTGRESKTHIWPTKIDEHFFAEVSTL